MRRLGKNVNGYSGETIDITRILSDCVEAAGKHTWLVEEIPVDGKRSLPALPRRAQAGNHLSPEARRAPRIYVPPGIHGDEPAGPLAARQLLQENAWPP